MEFSICFVVIFFESFPNTCDQHLNKVRQWRTESANIILDSVHIIVTYRPLCFTEMLVTPSPSWAHHDLYDQRI